MKSTEERFWAKVDKSGGPDACWTWTASLSASGYGRFNDGRRDVKAHRYAWASANGAIPPGEGYHGTCVLHACDHPPCVNPAHLFLGTQVVNLADMRTKGRHACGAAHGARMREVLPRGDAHWSRLRPERRPRGETNGRAKLTAAAIPVIRARRAAGECLRVIASDYGVGRQLISSIYRRERWAHIP